MLRATGDKSGTFLFSDKQVGTYTMSAQALDRRQHLVNTFLEGYEPLQVDSPLLPLYVLATAPAMRVRAGRRKAACGPSGA